MLADGMARSDMELTSVDRSLSLSARLKYNQNQMYLTMVKANGRIRINAEFIESIFEGKNFNYACSHLYESFFICSGFPKFKGNFHGGWGCIRFEFM